MKIALYVGSFDPPTNGHLWMIEQASHMFDQLVVAVGTNTSKSATIPAADRVALLKLSTAKLDNVTIGEFPRRYTVEYASEVRAGYLVRGIRASSDFEPERTIQLTNAELARVLEKPSPVTVFLMPPRELAEISSSIIKLLIGPPTTPFDGWEKAVRECVPSPVLEYLVAMLGANAMETPATVLARLNLPTQKTEDAGQDARVPLSQDTHTQKP